MSFYGNTAKILKIMKFKRTLEIQNHYYIENFPEIQNIDTKNISNKANQKKVWITL